MVNLKQLARNIFLETLHAIDIPVAMQRKLTCVGDKLCFDETHVNLSAYTKIRVVAIGKAAHAMSEGLASVLPADLSWEGIVCAPTAPAMKLKNLRYFVGGHPIPNQGSVDAARAILNLMKDCDDKSLVFFLLSGGGSALVELPLNEALTLEDVQQIHRALVTCGASIDAINTVRKHLSAVKGGRLAAAAASATKITFAVSDVPAGKESALASGPTLPDPSTVGEAKQIIQQYGLHDKFPPRLQSWLDAEKLSETPKPNDRAFSNSHFSLLLGMDDLFHPAHHAAECKGCITCCDNTTDDWPVERAVDFLLKQLAELKAIHPGQRVTLIADGELSSPVTGNGVGGRNSAFVLACVEKIAGQKIAVLSAGTDGIDGNSQAAGAVADGETLTRSKQAGMDAQDFFRRSDAFTFFSKLDDAIITGPTGNNLRDLRILIAED